MCEICNDEESDLLKGTDGKWYLRVENNNWDYHDDGFDYTDLEIKYCYWCGRML